MSMNAQEAADIFNARAAGYARDEWHRHYAEQFVAALPLREGDRVLDAGAGTGFAARAIARRVGPAGHVLAVDISPRMLEQARLGIDESQLRNVDLLEADVSDLPGLPDESLDAVVCSAGLLYLPVVKALREWRRLLEVNGVVAFSTMRAGSPSSGRLFRECAARVGLALPDPSEPLGSEARCRDALEQAGFDRLQMIPSRVDFETVDSRLAWEANYRAAGERARALSAEQRDMLHQDFLAALQREAESDPSRLARADVIFAFGRRPAAS